MIEVSVVPPGIEPDAGDGHVAPFSASVQVHVTPVSAAGGVSVRMALVTGPGPLLRATIT